MARSAAEPKPSTSRTAAIGAVLFLAVLATVAVWWVWPKSTQVPETVALAKSLLDNGGKPDTQAIRQVVMSVDRMPRDDLVQLRRAVGEEWRRLRQEAIDRYFTAPAAEKPQLLDAEIARLKALRELMLALNPEANPNEPPRIPREGGRGRRGRGDDPNANPPDEAAAKAATDRRAVVERYEEALATHAKSRRIALPTFR
ncbi:MAG: hypothetical protein WCO76_09200 [Planctomycetota bacterium]